MFMTEAKMLPGLPNISIQTTAMLMCLLVTNKDARATFWRRSVQCPASGNGNNGYIKIISTAGALVVITVLRGINHHPSSPSNFLLRSSIKPYSLFPWCSDHMAIYI